MVSWPHNGATEAVIISYIYLHNLSILNLKMYLCFDVSFWYFAIKLSNKS